MKPFTELKFSELCAALAEGYGVETAKVTQGFTVAPTVEQRLQDAITEQSEFLPLINVITVSELVGQNVLGSASGPVSGRTDTKVDGNERTPRDVLGLGSFPYQLYQTNSDVYIRYDTLDAWAKFKDFAERYTRYVQERIANDREMAGWYGVDAAADTDMTANPLLQDVNKGWLQYMRAHLPANILIEGATTGEIRIGTTGDFANLDHAVSDLLQGIPRYLRKGLITLVGDELISHEHAGLYKAIGNTPSEKVLATQSLSLLGGLPWMTPSNFPGRGLVITPLKNLSIYVQEESWRRKVEDNPKKDRIEDYNSRNEGYVVEVPEQLVGVEFDNVKISRDGGTTWE
ncbi:MAG: phage major capsid protein, P2 family [Pseudodesulfovibrio sp.]|uniref:Phage major capsid protein, P2 family n=1 Tax=Pseudodesulfovibrio aespoeensis (strain ATCC 700646 / DSM 10631 / Aspo-2) TaxID=643562 RepID=E6VXL3_PSEA9|nr:MULTISPECIES: phage major capsid protein, P2 family [Pseudodesulfovibrio]MBU4191449.1 phage major capsid protein, P2 family [Pseudomonadota bacterium]ADU61471.1 phage major capsid protein, P2 family [Pseudodesulfovibrio aespoeensis Aspo-2]MBU4243814.1 phage major capsid protein, P2 family [Pseudomonadota bacterium]MBU4380362.1 phage major capsid protein, P2 family [Pseudomonadota bacterium]MBU4475230.1 phage major capsid protein, P2 family [Pseudomonadota bacterium]